MFHSFNIFKHFSSSVLFSIISVYCFVFVFFFLILENNCPGGGVLTQLFCPKGSEFRTSFVPGGEEFAL